MSLPQPPSLPGLEVAPFRGVSWDFEARQASSWPGHAVAGFDEAGRGCWAGPVVAAVVLFRGQGEWASVLNDSKKLDRPKRRRLFAELSISSSVIRGVGQASVREIDTLNILQASFLAMERAWASLEREAGPVCALIDGSLVPGFLKGIPARAVVKGDGSCPSIAAASILAKETRDCLMEEAEVLHPGYGFAVHKGYGTSVHQKALKTYGPCAMHRRTFKPVALLLGQKDGPG
jgi:ribonuclease HII